MFLLRTYITPRLLRFLNLKIWFRGLTWPPPLIPLLWWFWLQIGFWERLCMNPTLRPRFLLLVLPGHRWAALWPLHGFAWHIWGSGRALNIWGSGRAGVRKATPDFLLLARGYVGLEISPWILASEKTAFWVLQSPLQPFFEAFLFFVWISRLNESGFKDDYERATGKCVHSERKRKPNEC